MCNDVENVFVSINCDDEEASMYVTMNIVCTMSSDL